MAVITNFGVPTDSSAGTTLMPKLSYRFRVTFEDLGGATSTDEVTQNVISAGRPSMTHEEVVVDSYNSKMYLAGKHAWEPISIVFRDDMKSNVIKKIGNQLNRQVDHADQHSSISGNAYKFGVTLETLDGANGSTSPTVFDKWELQGCYIANVQYGDLNYADSTMIQVTIQLRYDSAVHSIDGNDALSEKSASSDSAQSGATR
jgi:hypothetical protein